MKLYSFKLYYLTLILFTIYLIGLIKCQETLALNAVIYDNTPQRNPDFEPRLTGLPVQKNVVKSILGADNTPTYCCGDGKTLTVNNQTTFHSWFHNVPGVNLPIQKDIILRRSAPNSNLYTLQSNAFFIIDGLGFDDSARYPNEQKYYDSRGVRHNFHFCLQAHTTFQYKRGDIFYFAGDDDVWVFIDKRLVVDLGGNHQTASTDVNLDSMGLTVGQNYPFDFFYCERHTTQSTIKITTSLSFVCPYYDECGVCQGDNTSCCLPSNCDDNPLYKQQCIAAYCQNGACVKPSPSCSSNTPCFDGVCNVGVGCELVPRDCSSSSTCTIDFCNRTADVCQHSVIQNCIPCKFTSCYISDPCSIPTCSADGRSCIYIDRDCSDGNACTFDSCDFDTGFCNHLEELDCKSCSNDLACYTTDKCFPSVCSVDNLSCVNTTKTCDDGSPCSTDVCLSPLGTCAASIIPNCEECGTNACITNDFCFPQTCDTGTLTCTNTTKNCQSADDICNTVSCISPMGICLDEPLICDDGDPCTIDGCEADASFVGRCVFTPIDDCVGCQSINCITVDKCFPLVCTNGNTCVNETKSCDDNYECTIDTCNSPDGSCSHTIIPDCKGCGEIACITTNKCATQYCGHLGVREPSYCSTEFKDCDDNTFCTTENCNAPSGDCTFNQIENCVDCSPNFGCTTTNACFPQICDGNFNCRNTTKDCSDGNGCTYDFCNSDFGECYNVPIDNCVQCPVTLIPCITVDPCLPMICNSQGTECIETVKDCDDGNACTINECSSQLLGACVNPLIENCISCGVNNSIACITTDHCLTQICSLDGQQCESVPLVCSNNNPCTVETCVSPSGFCETTPLENCISCGQVACFSNDSCTQTFCSEDGNSCETQQLDCSDGNSCTSDSCTQFGCEYQTIEGCLICGPDTNCITTDYCFTQICSSSGQSCDTLPVVCNDNLACTDDICLNGTCSFIPIPNCFEPSTTSSSTSSTTTSTTSTTFSPTSSTTSSTPTSTTSRTLSYTSSSTNGYPVISTGDHYSESGTGEISRYACRNHHCSKGNDCQIINNKPECVPSKYVCIDCLDLQCESTGLSCKMIENPIYDLQPHGSNCCRFIPTCF